MITLEARALGRKTPLSPQWSIPAPALDRAEGAEPLTLRALIAGIVRDEVHAFTERQEQRRLLNVLTEQQIQEAAARGKVDMGGRAEELAPADEEGAVATALQAFEDGLYLTLIDGVEYRDLDAPVRLAPDSRITFLRLTMLAGG
jgi:hypothetical protein